jgi:membrane protein
MAIPGTSLSTKELGKRFYQHFLDNDLSGVAAELSYFFLFSIFPFLVFLVALTAYLPLQAEVDEALHRVAMVMPKEALALIQDHLTGLVKNQHPQLLSLGILATIWSASRGVSASLDGLNRAYAVRDQRSYFKVQGLAIGMTLASALLLFVAFFLIMLGGKLGFFIAGHLHLRGLYTFLWAGLRWPLSALTVMLTMAMNYYVLPDVKQRFTRILPGAVIGTLLWLLSAWGFTVYAGHFGNYNATYGSIGGVILLMTWLYLSGLSFLVGGELNAILAPVAARDGSAADFSRPSGVAEQDRAREGEGKVGGHDPGAQQLPERPAEPWSGAAQLRHLHPAAPT